MKPIVTKSKFLALRAEGKTEYAIVRDQQDFLFELWKPSAPLRQELFGALCFRKKGSQKFEQKFVRLYGNVELYKLLQKYERRTWDQYFCPNVFTRNSRKSRCAHMTRLAWCDVDEADAYAFKPSPSIIWETSPNRFQALWLWDKKYTPEKAEEFSRALTYQHGGDKNGWPVNKLLRLPGSINHKAEYDEPLVQLLRFNRTPILKRPKLLQHAKRNYSPKTQVLDMRPRAHRRLDVLKKHRLNLDITTRQLIRHNKAYAPDRSSRIFSMVSGLHEAGATNDEIASVIWDSPYFQSKYPNNTDALNTEISRIIAKIGGTS